MKSQRRKQVANFDIEEIVKELKIKSKISIKNFDHLIFTIENKIKIQPNILTISSPVTVVGDIHGQFYDLLNIFEKYGPPPSKKYLFLGDYVDRGAYNIEVVTLLLVYKLKYPQSIYLLRGNHETRSQTTIFNFRTQCLSKYNQTTYDELMNLFDALPISAIIDNKIFAVHGGISPHCKCLSDIQRINRFRQVPSKGGLCDLLWSDPVSQIIDQWEKNSERRCSFYFGIKQAQGFLNHNKLKMIIRGHEVQNQGFKYQSYQKVPLTLTIFSAPNYAGIYKNKGCVAEFNTDNSFNIRSFRECQPQTALPDFKDAFQLSIPQIGQSIQHMFKHLLKLSTKRLSKNIKDILSSKAKFHQDFEQFQKDHMKKQQFPTNDTKSSSIYNSIQPKDQIQNEKSSKNQQIVLIKCRRQSQNIAARQKQKDVIGPKLNLRSNLIKSFQ